MRTPSQIDVEHYLGSRQWVFLVLLIPIIFLYSPVLPSQANAPVPPLTHRSTKPITLLALTALIFYEVSGGPFGIEDAVSASSPLYALLGFIILPFVWSVPEALVTAELSTAFPENAGYVTWVAAAFGPFAGWMEGWMKWVSGVTDNTVYPILFAAYLERLVPALSGGLPRLAFLVLFTLALTYLNWRGLHVVGNAAICMAIYTLLPFLGMLVIALPRLRVENLLKTSTKPTDWGTFLNILFWNLNYFDSVATLAGEVRDPSRTFPRGLFLAVLLVIVSYLVPLAVGLGIGTDPALWTEGYLAAVAQMVGGRALAIWVLTAAAVSNVGQFLAEQNSDAFQVQGMSERGYLPAFFQRRSRHGTPTLGILLSSLGVVAMLCLDLVKIIELLNCIYCLAQLLEFAAFVKLRYSAPQLHRPFRVPAPTWLCALGLLPASLLLSVLLGLPVINGNILVLTYCGVTLVLGVLCYHWMNYLRDHGVLEFTAEPPSSDELIKASELRTPLMRPFDYAAGEGLGRDALFTSFSLGPALAGPPQEGFTTLTLRTGGAGGGRESAAEDLAGPPGTSEPAEHSGRKEAGMVAGLAPSTDREVAGGGGTGAGGGPNGFQFPSGRGTAGSGPGAMAAAPAVAHGGGGSGGKAQGGANKKGSKGKGKGRS